MPPLPPVPGVVKSVISGTIGTTPFANIFYWLMDTTSGLTNAQAQAIAVGVLNAYNTNLTPPLPTDVTVLACKTTDLTSATGGVGAASSSVSGTGGSSGNAASTCMLVKHLIARRYRGGHPRTYLPGLTSVNLINPQQWIASAVTAAQTHWNAFVSGVLATSVGGNTIDAHVSVSYHTGHALRVTPVIDNISGSVVEQTIATQRRRVGR